MANKFGPQKVDGIYLCGYWGKYYKVVAIEGSWITIEWEGETTPKRHLTPWDPQRDRVIYEPQS